MMIRDKLLMVISNEDTIDLVGAMMDIIEEQSDLIDGKNNRKDLAHAYIKFCLMLENLYQDHNVNPPRSLDEAIGTMLKNAVNIAYGVPKDVERSYSDESTQR